MLFFFALFFFNCSKIQNNRNLPLKSVCLTTYVQRVCRTMYIDVTFLQDPSQTLILPLNCTIIATANSSTSPRNQSPLGIFFIPSWLLSFDSYPIKTILILNIHNILRAQPIFWHNNIHWQFQDWAQRYSFKSKSGGVMHSILSSSICPCTQ